MLLLTKLLIDCCLFMLAWLVQVIIYPSFQYTDVQKLSFWHNRYQRLISYFVLPLMLSELIISFYYTLYDFSIVHLTHSGLVIIIWLSTFLHAVPVHQNIENQSNTEENIRKLVKVNTLRTLLWTVLLILSATELYTTFIKV
ncbi:hypothetical protein [Marivirga atlantica]|jgi:hypothetical protein|uniref:Uncharacterized protein n=1 Tax=Marivirga atlantica TaxID=1548457 RepID=A0A937DJX2_9BACT|nr:hypothetical protein [Marivirga atlantica]MBL0765651.1 hypothetical protein [Marivirga atlantica]